MKAEVIVSESREFRGIWIPAWLYLRRDLSWSEKILWLEIDSLDGNFGCIKRNSGFADFLGVSDRHVKRMLSSLYEKGCIAIDFPEGRRVIRSRMDEVTKRSRGVTKMSPRGDKNVTEGGQKGPFPLYREIQLGSHLGSPEPVKTPAEMKREWEESDEEW